MKQLYAWYHNLMRHPKYRGWVILASLAYILSPFDIAPDLVPFLGQIDDVALIMLLISGVFAWLTESAQVGTEETAVGDDEVDQSLGRAKETVDVKAVSVD
ncbi:MAG: DUF1232 domain-containing protein [Cyanothece sp. SIO1E1]|nr:DUF1232 domain-containing protein [Cyanothece sp. SIO1E1]